jgi:hypothetical protein
MKETKRCILVVILILVLASTGAFATPSTQIWNPSTDIQALGSVHLGIDNYFTIVWPQDGGYSYPTDIGLTYGVLPGLEIGIDSFSPSSAQYQFNAKYGVSENGSIPAFAIGAMNWGFNVDADKRSADWNIVYAVAAKTFDIGRISTGYYTGNDHVLLNKEGDKANTGFMLTWDKMITDKLWACVDHATGYSAYGSTFYGLSYAFSSNISVIFAYGTFNNGVSPVFTTQLDINL